MGKKKNKIHRLSLPSLLVSFLEQLIAGGQEVRTALLLEAESGLPAHPKAVRASPGIIWLSQVRFNFEPHSPTFFSS